MSELAPPSKAVKEELAELLRRDTTRLGQVFVLSERGMKPAEIAQELGVSTSNFVFNSTVMARAILDAAMPQAASLRPGTASKIRGLLRQELSDEARTYLSELSGALAAAQSSGSSTQRGADGSDGGTDGRPAPQSLRRQADDELRARTAALITRIKHDTGVDADDYARVRVSRSPMDEVAWHVLRQSAGRTFQALTAIRRRDLSLEAHVVAWADDLPIRNDLVEGARGRLDYYGHTEEQRA